MVVLVDARYFGTMLRAARRHQNIRACDIAQMFRVSVKQWRKYEHGTEPIPENVLMALFHRGFCMLQCGKMK